jgi:polyhydroxyalkanoate synthesis regulator phasin
MATSSGGSRSTGRRSGSRASATRKSGTRKSTSRSKTASRRTSSARSAPSAGRGDKSVQAFREALESSRGALEDNLTLSRERIQEVVDDAVERGRITRGDANELVSKLVSRGREASENLMRDIEQLLEQARREVETRAAPARRQATRAAGRVGRSVRDAADRPLAEADKLRRRTGAPGPAITGYDQLTAAQITTRLSDMTKADLRKVRTQEKRGKNRKGILDSIDNQLAR